MGSLSQRLSQMSPLKLAFAAGQLESQRELMNAEPIAVLGAGCRFPGGADSPDSFWRLLEMGTDAVTEVPSDRWNIEDYYDPDPDAPGKMYSRHGAFLDRVDLFDPAFFGITPREATSMDPQQRLLLEVSWEALENSGRSPEQLFGTPTGVFVGISTFDYAALRLALRARERIDAYFVSGSVLSVAAGRLSYLLGLTGPSMSVDTACSSSLVAVHLACQSLRNRECSLAIAGGVGLILAPEPSINFSRARMLARDGRCKTFDASADGYVRGEGCGIIVLKRLSDALADGDSIAAVVRGSAVNQDGPSGGLTVPSGPSQERVMLSALASGGVLPEQVSYIETHGTGTSLGDPIEAGAIGNVFGARSPNNPLLIGSVKTNIGHLEAAAGIAGIIKVLVSLQHRAIPPHLHFRDPSPHIQWNKFSLSVPTEMREWCSPDGRRIAGVSSFGFSGTNAHVVIEEAPANEKTCSEDTDRRLPTHSFNRQRYWIETGNAEERSGPVASHPLLGRRLHLPLSSEIRFETVFSHAGPACIRDHKLFGTIVVAGASHLALLLQAAKEAFAADACALEGVHLQEALVIPDAGRRIVQLVLTPEAPDRHSFPMNFKLLSAAEGEEGDGPWSQHVTGRIMPLADSKTVLMDNMSDWLNEVRHKWQTMPALEFYSSIAEAGHHLGPSFKWVESIYFEKREALCLMRSAGLKDSVDEYQLYPGLIDSCIQFFCIHGPQLVFGDSFGNPPGFEVSQGAIYIPFSIENLRFFCPPAGNAVLWCHTRVRENEQQDNSITGDIQLIDETGRMLADITGFTARRLDREVLRRGLGRGVDEWMYEMVWRRQALKDRVSGSIEQGSWLIFADRGRVGEGLAAILREHGEQCRLVYSNEADITGDGPLQELLSEDTGCRGVVHMWGLEAEEGITAVSLERSQDLCSVSAAQIVQALIRHGMTARPRLWLITRGAQPVEASVSESGLQQSTVWGLGKVLGLEHPELETVCVDLDPSVRGEEAERLFEEVWTPDGEDQIGYRDGERYAARLVRYKRKGGKRFEVRGGCSYLITGGFGALGLRLSEWLVEKGARNLVLSGRKGASGEALERIKGLEERGARVMLVKGDISSAEDVSRMFKEMEEELPELRGIIHAAGVIDDGVIAGQSRERFMKVMLPKVQGTWNLQEKTEGREMDFFVCFSSAASVLGSAGQGNYAAANAFMDAYAYYRRARGQHCLSVNWGAWGESGMAAGLDSRMQTRLAARGLSSIEPGRGLEALERLMEEDAVQAAVMPVEWNKYLHATYRNAPPSFFEEVKTVSVPSKELKGEIVKELEEAAEGERGPLLVAYLRAQVAAVLGMKYQEQIGLKQSLFDAGIDSLMAVELKNRIESGVGHPLRSTMIFDYPTVEKLAVYLTAEFTPQSSPERPAKNTPENKIEPKIGGGVQEPSAIEELIENELGELEAVLRRKKR